MIPEAKFVAKDRKYPTRFAFKTRLNVFEFLENFQGRLPDRPCINPYRKFRNEWFHLAISTIQTLYVHYMRNVTLILHASVDPR